MKTSSVDNPDEGLEERKQLENQSESVERPEEYDSDSSSSEDDDDMPGLTEEEEKERQREKREKVTEFLTPCNVTAFEPGHEKIGFLPVRKQRSRSALQ